jgi:membrane-associated phospholipid phosphatase
MNIWQILSISIFIFTYLPVILATLAKTKEEQSKHITTLLGAIATILISEGLKKTLFIPSNKGSPFARPAAARDCNAFCTDGAQGGAPGFPSTHSATATFLALSYYNVYKPQSFSLTILPLWAAILYSRITLQCHTWLQVGAGTLLGSLIYLVTN